MSRQEREEQGQAMEFHGLPPVIATGADKAGEAQRGTCTLTCPDGSVEVRENVTEDFCRALALETGCQCIWSTR